MSIFRNGKWSLRLLALILAIVVYYALKDKSVSHGHTNDRSIFQSH